MSATSKEKKKGKEMKKTKKEGKWSVL